jgi:hypothetical protein
MIVKTNIKNFQSAMDNIIDYSYGFIDGVKNGKTVFLEKLGKNLIIAIGQYIDINAKGNPQALHHVYEWYQTGSPQSRLFDIDYVVNKNGLSLSSSFRQSRTVSQDSNTPFYNKANIMENGIPVTIKPKSRSALAFESGGQTVFTKRPVTVRNPGGDDVQGAFKEIFDEFMLKYFKQSFIRASGLYDYINKPTVFKKNIKAGSKAGRSKGISTGYSWIINARMGVE